MVLFTLHLLKNIKACSSEWLNPLGKEEGQYNLIFRSDGGVHHDFLELKSIISVVVFIFLTFTFSFCVVFIRF